MVIRSQNTLISSIRNLVVSAYRPTSDPSEQKGRLVGFLAGTVPAAITAGIYGGYAVSQSATFNWEFPGFRAGTMDVMSGGIIAAAYGALLASHIATPIGHIVGQCLSAKKETHDPSPYSKGLAHTRNGKEQKLSSEDKTRASAIRVYCLVSLVTVVTGGLLAVNQGLSEIVVGKDLALDTTANFLRGSYNFGFLSVPISIAAAVIHGGLLARHRGAKAGAHN